LAVVDPSFVNYLVLLLVTNIAKVKLLYLLGFPTVIIICYLLFFLTKEYLIQFLVRYIAISLRWEIFLLLWFILVITLVHVVCVRRYLWYSVDDYWRIISILPPTPIAHVMAPIRSVRFLNFNMRSLGMCVIVYFWIGLIHFKHIIIIINDSGALFVMISLIVIIVVPLVTVPWVLTKTILTEHITISAWEILLPLKYLMVP
jgi:hypothetical protein